MTRIVERKEDMSPNGRLRLILQDDGDVIISVVPDPDNPSSYFGDSVEFCTIGSGGGGSPHTLKALRDLMKAIELDNKERPARRGETFGETDPGPVADEDPTIAWECVHYRRAKNPELYKDDQVARVTVSGGLFYKGQVVIVHDIYENKCVVERPMGLSQIGEQINKRSGLTTYGTCVGVPLANLKFLDEPSKTS